eukprot:TRINITY_DN842_c0_g1_i2.p1 TRINITY_DN842_c0_g1~~TRINITY_DN842_c0_g1_i2.p1  ORF type:complete len:264 (+),score=52.95 TRINITY_DN842_c0_g1_i2:648-1439(+)
MCFALQEASKLAEFLDSNAIPENQTELLAIAAKIRTTLIEFQESLDKLPSEKAKRWQFVDVTLPYTEAKAFFLSLNDLNNDIINAGLALVTLNGYNFHDTDGFPVLDMKKALSLELARLQTFHTTSNWPHQTHKFAQPSELASAGFFHDPNPTQTTTSDGSITIVGMDRCVTYCCELSVQNWEHEDNPWEIHFAGSPECPFVLNQKNNGNIPIASIMYLVRSLIDNTPHITPSYQTTINMLTMMFSFSITEPLNALIDTSRDY